jgi:hypothetical protein
MGESRYPLTRIIVTLALATLVASACTEQPQPPDRTSPTVGPSVAASPSPDPPSLDPPSLDETTSVIRGYFDEERGGSRGTRLMFASVWFDPTTVPTGCILHTDTYRGETHGAFMSDCQSWESTGHDVLIFLVLFGNRSRRPITVELGNVVLQSLDGRTFGPVDVRSDADVPDRFLPETLRLPSGDRWYGYVTFDGEVTDMVPASINYIDGKEMLRQVFRGDTGIRLGEDSAGSETDL